MAKGLSSDAAEKRWTVRGVPVEYRDRVTARAEATGQSVGQLLSDAIDLLLDGKPPESAGGGVSEAGAHVPSWAEVERRVTAAAAFAAATGKPMRRDVRKIGYDLLHQQFDGMKPVTAKREQPKAIAKAKPEPVLALAGRASAAAGD